MILSNTKSVVGVLCYVLIFSSAVFISDAFGKHNQFHSYYAELPGNNCTIDDDEPCWCIPEFPPETEEPDVDLFSLLTKGSEYLKNYTKENEAILMLGNTGTGKSTLTQIIAGDLSKLHAVSNGGADLVIIDEDNKIGLPSTKSKTLFPELVIKTDTDDGSPLPFYDFPGFDDTRGSEQDIAANFFMTEVAKKVSNYKMLFVVNSGSVSGQDRRLFDDLANHATTFVKDISKFSNSFGLLVNRVKSYNSRGKYIEDSTIINGTVVFLNYYKTDLVRDLENSNDEQEKEKISKKLIFVETLLIQNEDETYEKIWFVREPLECGLLSESDLMHETRKRIFEMTQRLQPTSVDHASGEDAFGFTLKAETILEISGFSLQVNNAVSSAIAEIAADFKLWFYHMKQKLTEEEEPLQSISDYFWSLDTHVYDLKKSVDAVEKNTVTLEQYAKLFQTFYAQVGNLLSAKFVDFMTWQDTYLNFFDKAANKRQERRTEIWKIPLEELPDLVGNFAGWYQFCKDLQNKTSQVSFFMKTYPIKEETSTWLKYIKTNDIITVDQNHEKYASFVKPEDLFIIDKLMIQALKNVSQTCDRNRKLLSFKGNFIRLGQFAGQLTEAIRDCEATEVEFIAGQAIFFDADITVPGVNFAFVSPNYDQRESGQFILDVKGGPGLVHSPPRAQDGIIGQPGQQGGRGSNADAGNPGEPAGNTFFVSSKVIGGGKGSIQVNTNGGDGGPGQRGGNGSASGKKADKVCFNGVRGGWDAPERCTYDSSDDYTKCTKTGVTGFTGGMGGNGGVGGKPGSKGSSSLLTFTSEATEAFHLIALEGETGEVGVGGQGGAGGESGAGYLHTTAVCFPTPLPPGPDGNSGATGTSSRNLRDPKPPPAKVCEWKALLQFRKNFFSYESQDAKQLLEEVDSSPEAEPFFTLKALADEALSLEQVDRSTANLARLRDMYVSLVNRLKRFYKKSFQGLSKQHQKVLSVLLTSSVAFQRNLHLSPYGTNIVVDISTQFNKTISKINDLKPISNRDQTNEAIQLEMQQLGAALDTKLYNSRVFIFEEVYLALFSAQNELQFKVDLLESQIVDLIKDSVSLEDARRKLSEAEKLQRTTRALKGFALLSKSIEKLYIPVDLFENMVDSLQQKCNSTEEKAWRLQGLVEECHNQIEDLIEKENQFEEQCIPLYNSLLDYFDNVTTSINSGEEVIPYSENNTLRKLRECKYILEEFADDSFSIKPLVNAFNRMQNALTFSLDLYSMVEYFIEVQDLARYIALMQSSALKSVQITDPEYVEAVRNFDLNIKENLLDEEVKRAVHTFKQWVFPFADFYLNSAGQLSRPKLIAPGDAQLRQIESLQEKLVRYKARPESERDTIVQLNFTNAINTSKAFYTWDNEVWEQEIESLFSSNKVSFEADIRKIGIKDWEAIKFKQIEIIPKMKGGTEEMREEFNEILNYFGVTMTHTGVSHYRFLQEYFVMTGGNHTIEYNFERDENGNRLGTNEVYEKFKSGEFMLSPYTLWTVQFRSVASNARKGRKGQNNFGFEDLKKFAPYIDLELEGIGTYVKGPEALNAAGGDMKLDKHYERDDSYKTDFNFQVTGNGD